MNTAETEVVLQHGDCLTLLAQMPGKQVSLIFADVPYGVTKCGWDIPIPFADMWPAFQRVSAPDAAHVFTATQPFASKLLLSNERHFSHDVVWEKSRATGFFNAKRAPLKSHEHILVFSQGRYTYNPIMVEGKRFCVTTKPGVSQVFGQGIDRSKAEHKGTLRYPKSVLRVPEPDLRLDTLNRHVSTRYHPTQKPVALLEHIIKTYSSEGDTILDPTAGSGSFALAAINVGGGRKVICIEKDPAYFEVMSKRVAEHRAKVSQ